MLQITTKPIKITCFHRASDHGDDGDEDGGDDVEEWPDEADLDRPLPLRMLPPQPGKAENSQADADLFIQKQGWVLEIADRLIGTFVQ